MKFNVTLPIEVNHIRVTIHLKNPITAPIPVHDNTVVLILDINTGRIVDWPVGQIWQVALKDTEALTYELLTPNNTPIVERHDPLLIPDWLRDANLIQVDETGHTGPAECLNVQSFFKHVKPKNVRLKILPPRTKNTKE